MSLYLLASYFIFFKLEDCKFPDGLDLIQFHIKRNLEHAFLHAQMIIESCGNKTCDQIFSQFDPLHLIIW